MKPVGFFLAVLIIPLSSCSSIPFLSPKGKAWTTPGALRPTSIALAYPDVDRQTAAASIEAELARLAPLLFMENGLPVIIGDGPTIGEVPCVAEIHAVEREYTTGWKTSRSSMLEIVIRRLHEDSAKESELIAAARIQTQGQVSLVSSRDLQKLLGSVVRVLADRIEEASGER